MFLNISNLKSHVAAELKGRYALNALALGPKGTISTDGRALLFVPYPDVAPADAPRIAGVNPTGPQEKPVLLDPKDAAKAAAMLGKRKRGSNPFTELVQVEVRGEELVLGATDLAASQTMNCRPIDGEFPNVGSVIPDYSGAHVVTLEIDLFLRALKALRGASKSSTLTLRQIDDQQAIGISCDDGVAMLVMPTTVEKPEEHCPDKLATLRQPVADAASADPVPVTAAPASPPTDNPEDEEPEEDEDWQPTEAEMEAAYEEMQKLEIAPKQPEPEVSEIPAVTAK